MMPRRGLAGFPFSLFIAWRYFFSKKSTAAVNVIALISVIGIALVALAMIAVLSIFNGFEAFTNSQLSTLSPEYVIARKDGAVFSASEVQVRGTAPVLEEELIASYGSNSQPLRVLGVDSSYLAATDIDSMVFEGSFELTRSEMPGVILGIGVAANLGAGANYRESLLFTVPKRIGRISPVMPQRGFVTQPLAVTGVFRVDQEEDRTTAFAPISTLRVMLQYDGDEVSYLALTRDAQASPSEIRAGLPKGFVLKDKVSQYPEIYRVLNVEKWVSVLLLVFVLILSLFSVVSTLGMLIIEKREDIEVLGILGARKKVQDDIIVLESWLLSVSGVFFGSLLGIALVWLQGRYGFLKLGGGGAFLLDAYPVELRASDVFLTIFLILFVGWISSRIAYLLFRRRLSNG